MSFQFPCEITECEIRGCLGEYPTKMLLKFYAKNGDEVARKECIYDPLTNDDPLIQNYGFDWGSSSVPFQRIRIEIKGWSAPYKLAKLSRVSCTLITAYPGSQIKSINILEEKTADADKLSYGISSNSCEVWVLNKDQKYLEKKNYDLLRKNRSVEPFAECGGIEYPLGKFFSEEWKVESGNQFFSCKAYDALYGLKNIEVLYPMEGGTLGANGQIVGSYKIDGYGTGGVSLYNIIVKFFMIVNQTMQGNGVQKNPYSYWVDTRLQNVKVPLALIETKSACDILQDVANAGCCYVYCDRDGEIYFQCDDFDNNATANYVRPAGIGDGTTHKSGTTDQEVLISPSNAFSYNLPSINKMIINKATVDFYKPETDTEENKPIEVDINDCEITDVEGGKKLKFTVELKNVFNEIRAITIQKKEKESAILTNYISDLEVSFDRLILTLTMPSSDGCKKISVALNNGNVGNNYKKSTFTDFNAESFLINGEQVYSHASNMLIDESRAKCIAQNIVAKYKNGLSYIDADWKGDAALEPGEIFQSYDMREKRLAKEAGRAPKPIDYECLSNEITFDGNYRQKTKARQNRA